MLNDRTLDAQSRAVIRYALETSDPGLAELVRRAEKGQAIADSIEQLARDSLSAPLFRADGRISHEESLSERNDSSCGACDFAKWTTEIA